MVAQDFYQKIGDSLDLGVLKSCETIQSLWSGYGELVRLVFEKRSVIVKHVKLPQKSEHPKGWNTNFSHQRKLHSYKVEVHWYEMFTQTMDKLCPVPVGLQTFQNENEWFIVMEDLATIGFTQTTMHPTQTQIESCLVWLAHFHTKYMNQKCDALWEIGTYWHLATRPDEFAMLEKSNLKSSARALDELLNTTKYQTFVHGDAKVANFCFNENGTKCAAVDFQYVGQGCGMKDVIYFMSSALEPRDCESMESWILDTYFNALKKALHYYQKEIDYNEIERQWRSLYEVAWADFYRFLKGWSPEHYKVNRYSQSMTKKALDTIKEYNV